MKNIFLIGMLTMITISVYAQLIDVANLNKGKYGIKVTTGFITTSKETTTLINEKSMTSQKIKFSSASPQISVGLWGQKKFGFLYADANVLYSRYGMNYEVYGSNSDDVNMKTISENYQYIDMQVMGGLTSNGFRIGVGPVAHVLAAHQTDLKDETYFNERMRAVSFGFSGAVGYDYKKFSFDIKFDKAFRTIGDHIYYGNRKSRFLETPDALTFSVAYQLF
ncbi:MAG: hypothetical protein IPN86_15040 [Saprospiraceae bacterium]|nr:hypothetical protein [Saprospiraceae bacterium]